MSFAGAEQQLIYTGCWRAATHGAVRSCRAVSVNESFSSSRARTTRTAAILPRCKQSVWIAGQNPCV
jgi:hypothetical protein